MTSLPTGTLGTSGLEITTAGFSSWATGAGGWVTRWPSVSGAIVGARPPEQVDGWMGGASLELTGHDFDEIAGAVGETEAGRGPSDPRRAYSA